MGSNHAVADPEWVAGLDELVGEFVKTQRCIAKSQARQSALLMQAAELAGRRATSSSRRFGSDLGVREVAAELAAVLRVTDRTVQSRMGDAVIVATRYERTLALWGRGRIDQGHVAVILDAGAVIQDAATRGEYERIVLAVAEFETPGRLRDVARSVAAQLDPAAVQERRHRAVDGRAVRMFDLDDGIIRIIADLPVAIGRGVYERLSEMAREQRDGDLADADAVPVGRTEAADADSAGGVAAEGDRARTGPCADKPVRTMDQYRADIFADLLLGGAPAAHDTGLGAIRADVHVTIPALTATGMGAEPALLEGYGPIDLDTALRLAAEAPRWTRVLTDPHTGTVLTVDRYRPSTALLQHLRARDEHCRFPGCRRRARRCDADHTIDAAHGGPTTHDNLSHLCRGHHTLKHHTDWTMTQHPGGVIEWESPTSRAYLDRPPSTVRFIPTDWLALATAPPPAGGQGSPF